MTVAQEARGPRSLGTAQPGPPGWRNEDGSRSKRKNSIIGRTPGSPGRSPSLQPVRPASVFCASVSRGFRSHGLAGEGSSTGGDHVGLGLAGRGGRFRVGHDGGFAPVVVGDGGGQDGVGVGRAVHEEEAVRLPASAAPATSGTGGPPSAPRGVPCERSFASVTSIVNIYNIYIVYIDAVNEVSVMTARGAQSC